ncbi:hypothetical protein TSOC_000872 [Tetrabaena socialis]|uniref:Uncharacterized protein n=1 Tax=Tetrabaena socialis TaxID=47790 RepID=A0A2J8AI97_9CHLO|nr:hypothetical protein TSOC_000872 [Tetrabaena socialis]|eukprot:PNH12237.1 hypothetical protein TSOC_000872 [Tetrabaena socialis]
MSKGVPVALRPDLKDASLAARLDAVFGGLGLPPGPAAAASAPAAAAAPTAAPSVGGWSLRADVQPFNSGRGVDAYNYSSDEEDPGEGLRPVMPSGLVDSDEDDGDADRDLGCAPAVRKRMSGELGGPEDEEEEEEAEARAERERARLRATLASRRAFAAEAEEDEYDRLATGSMAMRGRAAEEARPPGSTERRGFVPDHVRNPQRYTVYSLEEELVVGGGERRRANSRNGGSANGSGTNGSSTNGGGSLHVGGADAEAAKVLALGT